MAAYMRSISCILPFPDWLDHGNSIKSVYPEGTTYLVVRTVFPSMHMYVQHLLLALLWERQERVRVLEAAFDWKRAYSAKIEELPLMNRRGVHFHINLSDDGTQATGAKARLPHGTRVFIEVAGWSTRERFTNDAESMLTQFEGKVCASTKNGFDFSVHATFPKDLVDAGFRPDGSEWHHVYMTADPVDPDKERRMEIIAEQPKMSLLVAPKPNEEMVNGRLVGIFYIRNLIGEQRTDVYSPDSRVQFLKSHPGHVGLQRLQQATPLLTAAKLNRQQHDWVERSLRALEAKMIALEGLPGTGKSYAIAVFVAVLMIMDKKVVGTAQSNAGVIAMFNTMSTLLSKSESTRHLLARLLQIRNATTEELYNEQYRGDMKKRSSLCTR